MILAGARLQKRVTGSFIKSVPFTADLTTYSDATFDFGAEHPSRVIAVAVIGTGGANASVSSISIGGVTATLLAEANNGVSRVARIGYALVPTGTTSQTVSVTFGGAKSRAYIAAWRILNAQSASASNTAYGSTTAPTVAGVTTREGVDFTVCAGVLMAATSCAWSGATERDDQTVEGSDTCTAADRSADLGTITATFGATNQGALLTATFLPLG